MTAAFVTLAIEYAAKPRLEARKDRIVARVRVRQEALTAVGLAHANFGMIHDVLQVGARKPEDRDFIQREVAKFRNEIEGHHADLLRASFLLYDEKDGIVYRVLTRTAGTFITGANPRTSSKISLDEITDAVVFSTGVLTTGRRSRSGRRLRREAREWTWIGLDKDEAD